MSFLRISEFKNENLLKTTIIENGNSPSSALSRNREIFITNGYVISPYMRGTLSVSRRTFSLMESVHKKGVIYTAVLISYDSYGMALHNVNTIVERMSDGPLKEHLIQTMQDLTDDEAPTKMPTQKTQASTQILDRPQERPRERPQSNQDAYVRRSFANYGQFLDSWRLQENYWMPNSTLYEINAPGPWTPITRNDSSNDSSNSSGNGSSNGSSDTLRLNRSRCWGLDSIDAASEAIRRMSE